MINSYKFNLDDDALIKLIALYNQKIEIKRIKEDDVLCEDYIDGTKTGADLVSIVEEAKKRGVKTIKISYRHTASETLYGVFPKFSQIGAGNSPDREDLLSHFGDIYDRTTGQEGNRISELPDLKPLTEDEAINFICSRESAEISGILHLAAHNALLFEMNRYCCSLIYGDEPELTIIKKLSLDVQDGFSFAFHECFYNFLGDLQDYFDAWQKRNYQGPLFPDSLGVSPINRDASICEMSIETDSPQSSPNKTGFLISDFPSMLASIVQPDPLASKPTRTFELKRPQIPLSEEQLLSLIKKGSITEIKESAEDGIRAMLGLPLLFNSDTTPRFKVDESVIKELLLQSKLNPEEKTCFDKYCRRSRHFSNQFSKEIHVSLTGFYIKKSRDYLITEVGLYFESNHLQTLDKNLKNHDVLSLIQKINNVDQVVTAPIFTTRWSEGKDNYEYLYNDMKPLNLWLHKYFNHQNVDYEMQCYKMLLSQRRV
ncbi:hypothetical protein [Legionella genomosp. 1]|uniref:hypothetical protein n=1 Tax=Legionella genomosp. 1 TaxID=1093625 RepID=UPI0010553376|nr:hypothetical protein [Legionella genomosp. 1]